MGKRRPRAAVISCLMLGVSLVTLVCAANSEEAGLTAEQYIQFKIGIMENQVSTWQSKIDILGAFEGEASDFLELEMQASELQWAEIDSLYAAYGIDFRELARYETTHEPEIAEYLSGNPSLTELIAGLETQTENLVSQYETLLGQREIRGPVPRTRRTLIDR